MEKKSIHRSLSNSRGKWKRPILVILTREKYTNGKHNQERVLSYCKGPTMTGANFSNDACYLMNGPPGEEICMPCSEFVLPPGS